MRTTRGLIASLGASLSLVLAGTLALAAVSTVIAFQGWPGVSDSAHRSERAVLAADPQAAARTTSTATRPRAEASLVVPAARRRTATVHVIAPRRAAAARQAPAVVHAVRPTQSAVPADSVAGTSTSAAATAAPPHTSTTPAALPVQPGDPVRKVGDGLGGAVDKTGQNLGQAVQPVAPSVGQTVQDVGTAVGNTVQNVTNDVGAILDALKPKQ